MGETNTRSTNVLARYLSRRTSGRQIIPEIDGLRSVAILSVLVFHAAWTFREGLGEQLTATGRLLDAVIDTGDYGVPVFFVISGFILALPFAEAMTGGAAVSLTRYIKRRVTRLEPPFFVALLAAFALLVVQTGSLEKLPNLLASSLYLHSAVFGERSHVLPVSWSLEVEVQFYLIMPALAFIYKVRSAALRRGLLIAGILGFSFVFGRDTPIWGRTVVHQAGYFLAGMLLADLYRTGWLGLGASEERDRPRAAVLAWDLLAAASLASAFAVRGLGWMPAQTAPWLILIGFIAVFRGGLVRSLFRWTPVVILGGMCYSIYLWHFFLMRAGWPIWEKLAVPDATPVHLVIFIVVASGATLAVSTLMFVLVERPTMDAAWPAKLGRAISGLARSNRGEPRAERARRRAAGAAGS